MASEELAYTPAWRLAELIRSRHLSPVEVTAHFLERIHTIDPQLNAFITVVDEQAMQAARAAEAAVMAGEKLGPLHGVPIAIKDLSATKGIRTTHGSLLHRDRVPDYDDIPMERIRKAGAIILGKTNTPEFGWKATTENLLTGACRNPWDPSRTSGGSSGGSAAALAAGLCALALGSDAGGSIRIPASFCGVFGIKPTFGRVPSDYEGPGGWRTLSQNGPMAHNVSDAALLLQVLAGPDSRDATCIQEQPPDFGSAVAGPAVHGMRIAWSPDLDGRPVDPDVRQITSAAVEAFREMGASVQEDTPEILTDPLIIVFSTLMLTDLAIGLGPTLEAGLEAKLPGTLVRWVKAAAAWPATRYSAHLRELERHRRRMDSFFQRYDLLLTPTMAVPAFPIEQPPHAIDGNTVDPHWGFTPFLYPFNMSGQPAASVPCGFTRDGLPVGLQIVGRRDRELDVLRVAAAFEAARPWSHRRPLPTHPANP
jgi:Asp-tRNA(Asn)/Glu-tRNA(Gln) amidotransferase A subunit family amidase